jgi:radical SAM protein (TIGR01212 family)
MNRDTSGSLPPAFPWGTSRRFNAYVDRMRKLWGGRVQKLTLDAGFTCPNRDGTRGSGGCTFCLNDAFNPSYCVPEKTISQQIEEGIAFHARRYRRADRFLAYFQAFSNTYAPVEELERKYQEALNCDGIIGLVIGTRPDCMDAGKLHLLKEHSAKAFIMVEYGIESVYDRTLDRVNRGHTWAEAVEAVESTAAAGVHTGAHFIFGLPGETREEMEASAVQISALPLSSVKFHQLQLFKGTAMAGEYLNKPEDFHFMDQEEYLDLMLRVVERLNPEIAIERIAGETPPRFAVHKPWGPRYDQILARFEELLEARNTWQGKEWVSRVAAR